MNVLLLGGGGREHALAWAIRRSPLVSQLHAAPGNPGIAALADCHAVDPADPQAVAALAASLRAELVVAGPEGPLVAGVADLLEARGIPVFGPSRAAAEMEGSKVASKRFMEKHGIATAAFRVFDRFADARAWLASAEARFPLVVKADGLAAGKGVVICADRAEAEAAAGDMLDRCVFGDAGKRILIEECLVGREASFFVLCDGRRGMPLATCQDYKRLGDADAGPNTGGMGGFSPSPFLDEALRARVMEQVAAPTLAGLAAEGRPFRGVLFIGLMLTADGPKVLEYNVRFGDPETQALLPRLRSDLVPYLAGAARGELPAQPPEWRPEVSVCVVLAAPGYPSSPRTGARITGLDGTAGEDLHVFHAGTRRAEDGSVVTSGGRVLAVVALAPDFPAARARAYAAAGSIGFDGRQMRADIAAGL